jgi:hypothetical protein
VKSHSTDCTTANICCGRRTDSVSMACCRIMCLQSWTACRRKAAACRACNRVPAAWRPPKDGHVWLLSTLACQQPQPAQRLAQHKAAPQRQNTRGEGSHGNVVLCYLQPSELAIYEARGAHVQPGATAREQGIKPCH